MIFRRRHTTNFTTIGNGLFDDERLKLDELGILTWLLSRPENWEVRRPQLRKRFKIGRDALRRIVTNLVKYGWATACRKRLSNGTFYTVYEIRDECSPELTDDEVRAIFSLESGEGGFSDDVEGSVDELEEEASDQGGLVAMECGLPAVQGGLPATADPPWPIYKNLINPESTKSEREYARAREKHALMLTEFKRRYPTAASDDQAKIDEEWFKLELDEGEPAIGSIPAFLEKLKRDKRTTTPAAWRYLKEKRWTLLEPAQAKSASLSGYPLTSPEGRAICTLYEIAGKTHFLHSVVIRNGTVYDYQPITPRLLALAQAGPKDNWPVLNRNGGGSWENLLREALPPTLTRRPLREGDRAPWPFAPSKDGKIYDAASATGPPFVEDTLMTEDDMQEQI